MKSLSKNLSSKLSILSQKIQQTYAQITPQVVGYALLTIAIIAIIFDYPYYLADKSTKQFIDFSFEDWICYPINAVGRSLNRLLSFFENLISGSCSRGSDMILNLFMTIKSIANFFGYLIYQIWEMFVSICNFFATFLRIFEMFLNFSQFLDDLIRKFAKIFQPLKQIFSLLFQPFYKLLKSIIPLFKKIVYSIFKLIIQFFHRLFQSARKLASGTTRVASKLCQSIINLYHKIPRISFTGLFSIFKYLLSYLGALGDLIMQIPQFLYYIFSHLIEIIIKVKNQFIQIFINIFPLLNNYIIHTLSSMKNDVVRLFSIFKNGSYVFRFFINALNFVFELINQILLYVIYLPRQIISFIFHLFVHPYETIKSYVIYFFNFIDEVLSKFFDLFHIDILRVISNCVKTAANRLKKSVMRIRSGLFKVFYLPSLIFEKLIIQFEHLVNVLASSVYSIVNDVRNVFSKLFSFLSNFSIQKLIRILFSPFTLLLRALQSLSQIPILKIICGILRTIIYIPLWIVSFVIRCVYFIMASFMNFFSNQYSLDNIFDMWDNVCWPRDAEYCKKVLIDRNQPTDDDYTNYRSDYVYNQ